MAKVIGPRNGHHPQIVCAVYQPSWFLALVDRRAPDYRPLRLTSWHGWTVQTLHRSDGRRDDYRSRYVKIGSRYAVFLTLARFDRLVGDRG